MIPSLEPLFCPCCTPAVLHALSQYGFQALPLSLLGTGALSAALGLDKKSEPLAVSSERSPDSLSQL
jgi:hypothetical protein